MLGRPHVAKHCLSTVYSIVLVGGELGMSFAILWKIYFLQSCSADDDDEEEAGALKFVCECGHDDDGLPDALLLLLHRNVIPFCTEFNRLRSWVQKTNWLRSWRTEKKKLRAKRVNTNSNIIESQIRAACWTTTIIITVNADPIKPQRPFALILYVHFKFVWQRACWLVLLCLIKTFRIITYHCLPKKAKIQQHMDRKCRKGT